MASNTIGFLHPGSMGVSLAATALNTGCRAFWSSAGRSVETRRRADTNGLTELATMRELCDRCDVIISVCPPHAASSVADEVRSHGFKGVYADVNAIAPERTRAIGTRMNESGAAFVDGGIIGGPAWEPGSTVLYLSGPEADPVARCFTAGPLETIVIGEEVGKASALKMCFAANTKGTAALMCAVVAAADKLGVLDDLERQWSRDDEGFAGRTRDRMVRVTAKAWRFSGEMAEIADTLESAGLPAGFHRAAEEVYRRMAGFKGAETLPSFEEVIRQIQTPRDE